MGDQFLVELVAEHDDVLELRRQCPLIRMLPAVPALRFPHEVESASLEHRRWTGVESNARRVVLEFADCPGLAG